MTYSTFALRKKQLWTIVVVLVLAGVLLAVRFARAPKSPEADIYLADPQAQATATERTVESGQPNFDTVQLPQPTQ